MREMMEGNNVRETVEGNDGGKWRETLSLYSGL